MTTIDVEELADRLAEQLAERLNRAPQPLLSPKQVARLLSLSDRQVRNLLSSRVLPSLKIEGSRRVTQEAFDAYVAARADEA